MSMTCYQPFTRLIDFSQELERAIEAKQQAQANPINQWRPTVDIIEKDDVFVLNMDVPGVDPKTIEVSMEKGVLEVSAERMTVDRDQEGMAVLRQERKQGDFNRRFRLPETAESSDITAKSEFGVLQIVIRKKTEMQPRRITITH